MTEPSQPITRAAHDASREQTSQSLRELKLLVHEAQGAAAIPEAIAKAFTKTLATEEAGGAIVYDVMFDFAVINGCADILFLNTDSLQSESKPSPSLAGAYAQLARPCQLGKVCSLETVVSRDRGLLVWFVSRELSESDVRTANSRLKSRPVIIATTNPTWLDHVELQSCEKVTAMSVEVSIEIFLREAQELANTHAAAFLERCGQVTTGLVLTTAISVDIVQRLSSRRRFLQTRLNAATLEAEIAEATRNDSSSRNASDTLRSAIDSKADEVMAGAQSVIAEWFGVRGKLNQLILTHVQNLGDNDFDTEASYSKLVRRLSPRIGSELKIALQQNAKDLFKAATKASREAVTILQQDCFARCRPLGMEEINYRSLPIDEERGWAALKSQIEVTIDIKFEMNKRGILKRLSEGKQIMATTMMSLGIIGMVVGFRWRENTTILYTLPVIFIAGFIYSFYSWKQEDRETLGKELERVRDTITRELSRSLSESERVIVEYVRRSINDSAKHIFNYVDQTMKLSTSKRSTEIADRRTRVRDQMRRLEIDVRAVDQMVTKARLIRF